MFTLDILLEKMTLLFSFNAVLFIVFVFTQTLFGIGYKLIYKMLSYVRCLMSKQDKDLEKNNLYLLEILKILRERNHD